MKVIVTDPKTDESRFTHGACFILAEVIHDLTGWPICSFWNNYVDDFDWHVFILTPDGRFLDVRGWQTENELRDRWGWDKAIVTDIDSMELFNWTCPFDRKESYKRAREIAPDLIKEGGF
jgi:hypothetical protein